MAEVQYLDDLLDVQVPAPNDGDVLYWDAATSLWKHKPIPVGEGGTVERAIRASTDDCRVKTLPSSPNIDLDYYDNYVGYYDASNYGIGSGLRFLNIYIPQGAIIAHAYLKQIASENRDEATVNSRLRGELNANPLTFSTYDDYMARDRTDVSIDWDNIPAWTKDTEYTSPDFKSVIQEIVNLPAFASGNPIVIFWDDHDDRSTHVSSTKRNGYSWDDPARKPPLLYVEWTA